MLIDISPHIIFEDKWIIVVDKPSGLPSQGTRDPARDHLVAAVERYLRLTDPKARAALHHRLDVETSGVIVLGKHKDANKGLTDAFRERLAQKTYLAVVVGEFPEEAAVTNHLASKRDGKRNRMVPVRAGGDFAETKFKLRRFEGGLSVVEAYPKTGRMHQIRVHLAGLGFPIVGDSFYGGVTRWDGARVARMMLHAWRLELPHPVTGDRLVLDAPVEEGSALLR